MTEYEMVVRLINYCEDCRNCLEQCKIYDLCDECPSAFEMWENGDLIRAYERIIKER